MNVYSGFFIGVNLEYVSILFFKLRTHYMKSLTLLAKILFFF